MHRRTIVAAALAASAIPASAAQAHVTLQPNTATAGAYTVESVRVPNETDDATTTKVQVQLPEGFADVLYQAAPGWKAEVVKQKLATPIKTDDGEVTEGVREITWTADSKADGIAPGEFKDFPLSLQIPDKAGTTLTFKALQTYSDGEVARWIGPESADKPAPTVKVTTAAATTQAAAPKPAAAASSSSDGGGDGDGTTLAIVALVVGVVGVGVGAAGLNAARRLRTA